jgi:alpha-beta hydrolase superfamily lysophospholipase
MAGPAFAARRGPFLGLIFQAALADRTDTCADSHRGRGQENLAVSKSTAQHGWLPNLLAGMVLSTGIGYVAAAYTISRWLTRPSPGRPPLTPDEFGLSWERLECVTADQHRLAGWAVSPPRPRATVALFHGIRNDRSRTLGRAAFLCAAGYRCVAFDHRAHGESSGRRTSFGYHEGRDVAAVLDLVQRRWPDQPRAALGMSMGAAALCFAAPHTRACAAVVLESCYFDISTAFESRLRNGFPPWYQRLSRGVIWLTERRLGIKLAQLSPAEHIGALAPAPVLVLTGAEDLHATASEAQLLYERCRGPRELWVVPGAKHNDILEVGGAAYQRRVLDFLSRWLPA